MSGGCHISKNRPLVSGRQRREGFSTNVVQPTEPPGGDLRQSELHCRNPPQETKLIIVENGTSLNQCKSRYPEHPYSLEELKVITEDAIEVDDKRSYVRVTFTPTVEHCSMATVIGLCLRVKLMRSLPSRFKVDIKVAPGTHATEEAGLNSLLNLI
ncbi:unnamed protein product [Lactuca saligna]|uniref:MIP18 family-like domain-containing protein n=1 Tax=Lactuca saligna TaxID=75948 RepID=A0AA35V2J9_LACSI|nr:unnamed protein product [Lactuca saligna]